MSRYCKPASLALAASLVAFGYATLAGARASENKVLVAETSSSAATQEDFKAVKAVCTRCHGVEIFNNKPRTWNRWNEVFVRMTARGAHPTEDQVDHIVRYFLANLTLVNVNSSPADELGPALGVSEAVANQIVQRRAKRKFRDLADLRSVSGVNPAVLEQRKSRIEF